ncbi:MAG: hypothetical protein Ct9H300mP23_03080 [Nitrospinota bacterium]|nr:MAG: hypothetical protein Ct9H300mP23_03080 [Nitrospinota bacterium]
MTQAFNWARKFSLFYLSLHYGMLWKGNLCRSRSQIRPGSNGCGFPVFTRQADLLMVVGTISHKQAPILVKVYNQMTKPQMGVAYGVVPSPVVL